MLLDLARKCEQFLRFVWIRSKIDCIKRKAVHSIWNDFVMKLVLWKLANLVTMLFFEFFV